MTSFQRGLTDPVVKFLNDEYQASDSFWRSLIDDNRFFLAIRNNYLNAYRHGCSFVKIDPNLNSKELKCSTASKYLVKSGSVVSINGLIPCDSLEMYEDLRSENDRQGILRNMQKYAGPEAIGVTELLKKNINVVDVEVAIPGEKTRVDLVAAQKTDLGHELVFYEAKTIFDSRVRASGEGIPEVIGQMEKYAHALKANEGLILDSYRTVISNFRMLKGFTGDRLDFFENIDVDKLSLCLQPKLIFVGYTAASKKDWLESNALHHEKLIGALGKESVFIGRKTL
ncbi:hypothetical protein [Desulfovibrio sp. JC022]|uniref:hypothetical protein n=1 Tax=Desulfovibrio sp. JC022 TaxID=2593642 RepID=UPI0013D54848|nr:hypothetical protein [Desulfovibrio sp. JC022]NDV24739.1 hypothetical protein [Desulfovibrio sp. JC022]